MEGLKLIRRSPLGLVEGLELMAGLAADTHEHLIGTPPKPAAEAWCFCSTARNPALTSACLGCERSGSRLPLSWAGYGTDRPATSASLMPSRQREGGAAREWEVHHERTDRQERPLLTERPPSGLGRATALGECADEADGALTGGAPPVPAAD